MIEREIAPQLTDLHQRYPVVTVTGPRQSGKTTLCRAAFPGLRYLNLEAPDQRQFAESDPRGFLAQARDGAIIDEIQNVPDLLSYIQVDVDERGRNGLYVLTGSEQFRVSRAISQSLAGRTALLRLLPFSMAERARTDASMAVDEIIFSGFYPRIVHQKLDPVQALGDYFETYVERDIRRSNEIRNIASFRRFVRLCAGRVGQLVNLSSLGADVGVSHTTASEWLTVLEASYVVFRLPPYHANIGKRLIKSPKLYFYDVGLASFLIGIENAKQVATHPLRGPLFENAAVMEALKHRFNRGRQPLLWFFRDSSGLECDVLCETGQGFAALECKSGSTVSSDHFKALHRVAGIVPRVVSKTVVYGGAARQQRTGAAAVPLAEMGGVLDLLDTDHDVSEFISRRAGPEPSQLDVERLNAVYQRQVRPTLEGLERFCNEIGQELFESHEATTRILRGRREYESPTLLEERGWRRMETELLLFPGFKLSDERPIKVFYEHLFSGYCGSGRAGFGLRLRILWSLGSLAFERKATVDSCPVPGIDATFSHEDPASVPADSDSTVAAVVKSLLDRIEKLSTT